jgi:hypothetical protein
MLLKKYELNGEILCWRMKLEYIKYRNDSMYDINAGYISTSVNGTPYRKILNINWNNIHGILAALLIIYNDRFDCDVRIEVPDRLEEYLENWFYNGDLDYTSWIYKKNKDKGADYNIRKVEKVLIARLRNLYPYDYYKKFKNIPDTDDEDQEYDLFCDYVDTLSRQLINEIVKDLVILHKENRLDEFNPFNLCDEAFKIYDHKLVEKDNEELLTKGRIDLSSVLEENPLKKALEEAERFMREQPREYQRWVSSVLARENERNPYLRQNIRSVELTDEDIIRLANLGLWENEIEYE